MLSTATTSALLESMWRTTWQASLLILVVLALTTILRRWIVPRWRLTLWAVPTCRLLMFIVPTSVFSLFNLFAPGSPETLHVATARATPSADFAQIGEITPESPHGSSSLEVSAQSSLNTTPTATSLGPDQKSQSLPAAEANRTVWLAPSSAIFGVWLIGCLASLFSWIVSHRALQRMIATGHSRIDRVLVEMIESRCESLRLRRKVRCVVLDSDVGPAVCGLLWPTILMPSKLLSELDSDQLRTVLHHEIEHIRRWDGAYSVVCRLVTMVHWFNPLAYLVHRRIRHEMELAVDTTMVAGLDEPIRESYGELLIRLTQRPLQLHQIVHMSSSSLGSRIDELMSPTPTSPLRSTLAFLAAVTLVLGGLTDAASTQDPDPQDKQIVQQPPTDVKPRGAKTILDKKIARIHRTPNWRFIDQEFIEEIKKRQPGLKGVGVNVSGVVQDDQGQPVDGAFVLLRVRHNYRSRHRADGGIVRVPSDHVFAVAWTDAGGEFAFRNQPAPWFEPAYSIEWELCVFASGWAVETRKYKWLDQRVRTEKIQLRPECVIEGTVKDPDGKAISDFEIAHAETMNPYRNRRGPSVRLEYTVFRSEMECFVKSDAQGRFRIGGLPPQRIANLIRKNAMKFGTSYVIHIATSPHLNPANMIEDKPSANMFPYLNPVFEIVIPDHGATGEANLPPRKTTAERRPTRTVTVRVVNAVDGTSVPEVGAGWDHNIDEPRIFAGMQATDKGGIAKLEIPQHAVDVYIGGRRFGFVTRYGRQTTDPTEYTPPVQRADWVRRISPGEDDVEVLFKLQPVAPLNITVQKRDGTPVIAEVLVSRHGWEDLPQLPIFKSDQQGHASAAIRPVFFYIDITATTADGLTGSRRVQLSENFKEAESTTIVVE